MDDFIKTALHRIDRAVAARTEREGLWRSLQNYVRPTSLSFRETQANADTRERRILESTAARSLELFASFLMSSVLVAGTAGAPAFRLVARGRDGEEITSLAAKEWLEEAVQEIRHTLFSGTFAGVPVLHNVCLDLGLFGTSCFAVWEGPDRTERPVVFKHYPVWQVAGENGEDGRLTFVTLTEKLSKPQAFQRFPTAGEALEKQGDVIEVHYMCVSKNDGDVARLVPEATRAFGGSWFGVWFLKNPHTILDTRVYQEQPIFMPSWYSVDNSVWGRSPAMTALGDIISANVLVEMIVRGTEKLVDPPWIVKDGALLSPLRAYPGGLTYTDSEEGLKPLLPPGASRIEVGTELLRDRVRQIEEAFFIHLFQDLGNPSGSKQPRTATEVAIQQDERNRAVTPMVMRLQATMIEPLVWRVLGLLVRAGRIPAPPIGEGARLYVKHQSPVVASQTQVDGIAVMRFFQGLAAIAQANPEVLDYLDVDAVAKLLHTASGAPVGVLRSDADVRRLRQARAEAQAQATQLSVANEGGKTLAALISAQAKASGGV